MKEPRFVILIYIHTTAQLTTSTSFLQVTLPLNPTSRCITQPIPHILPRSHAFLLITKPIRLLNNRRRFFNPSSQNMPFNEIWQPRFGFIGQKFFGRHGKDLVDFFECELFGFADKGEYHEPCD